MRHGLAAICSTLMISVVMGVPAIAGDADTPIGEDISVSTPQPADATPQPADATPQPADATPQPADATPQPADETPPPADAAPPPDATQQPAAATPPPTDTTQHPVAETPPPDHLVVQDVEIESIQVAVANTGDNFSTSDAPSGPPSGTPGTDLGTGSASAVGSSDSTAIGQRVVTDLQDGATAEIVQISIVFNIGGAVANTGDNALDSGSGARGDGSIATGSAAAVGNSADISVTQGAHGQATSGENDEVNQHSATLQIGLSMANSGGNVISATLTTTGGPATARTGAATAVGNLSATAIDQVVSASGRGSAVLRIEQRATVVNFGIAFAGTGGNQIGADFSAALMRGDGDALEQLLTLILPALFESTPGTGAGAVTTGDATAIGNRSNTRVLQTAIGEADSGWVGIRQDVMVVNAGAASATTGYNSIGASAGNQRSVASPGAHEVVGQLTSFIRTMMADISGWASGSNTSSAPGSGALATTFGDFDIGIDRSVVASSATAAAITTRQLAAVINLAVARSNSGGNRATVATSEARLAAAFADPTVVTALEEAGAGAVLVTGNTRPLLIVTGDASAANTSVVVVCQRADFPELTCLGPVIDETSPPTETPPPATPPAATTPTLTPAAATPAAVTPATVEPRAVTPVPTRPPTDPAAAVTGPFGPSAAARSLPATGTDSGRLMLAALALLLFGSGLLVVSRQRT